MRLLCPVLLSALVAPVWAAAQTPPADGPTLSVETRAQDLYVSGRDRFRAKDYVGATEDFRRSLDLVDSPNTRMYLGRALRRLARLPEAYATLDRAATDAERRAVTEPRYAATQTSARDEANEIRANIALLTVRVPRMPAEATIRVGGAEVPVTAIGFPLPFVPGEVIVEFDAPGFAPAREILILSPGGEAIVELVPRAESSAAQSPSPRNPAEARRIVPSLRIADPIPRTGIRPWSAPRVLGVAALSAGAAAIVTGVVFGTIAWSEHEALTTQRPPDQALATRGEFHRDVANVFIASGAAVAASGLLLFWLGGRGSTDAQPPPVRVDVGLNASGPTIVVGGTL